MKIFLTGATGYIGTAIAQKLLTAEHDVIGLARNEAAAEKLKTRNIEPFLSDLRDTDHLIRAARTADAVIHTAFNHDFSDFEGAVRVEREAIAAFVTALSGSGKPFVATSGTGLIEDTGDRFVDDTEIITPRGALIARAAAEQDILLAAQQDICSMVLRLPIFVYGYGGSAFIPFLIRDARAVGVARYIEPGDYKYSVVHVDDVATLYALALEKGKPGSVYHAVSESGITIKAIATAVARIVGCETQKISKAEAIQIWGQAMTTFFSINNQLSCSRAERDLGWQPQGNISLLKDITDGSYS
jgi:nucleoside-diphosphate-sugar epimerase